ncbi:WhiB family transcriptional regulator [Amycolatopsis sp. lyj-112]|uniref:WhiB family transcriptional regulator n=1 Tax=Amycolatopsis sp. lyj-112 TaxID=2789288 RepID=UPI0039785FA8
MEMMMVGDLSQAACRGVDPELFFPVTEIGPGAQQVARAKDVCARCPVASACLDFAVDNGLAYGVFGGLSGAERRRLILVPSAA